jgi:phosphoenolpyruvate-protein kinase (PTS system EI component)
VSLQVFGLAVSRGIAIGRAMLVASSRVDVAHYYIAPEHAAAEVQRLRRARDEVAEEFEALQRDLPADAHWGVRAIAFVALVFGTLNVIGGFLVTDRMLSMFKGKAKKSAAQADVKVDVK